MSTENPAADPLPQSAADPLRKPADTADERAVVNPAAAAAAIPAVDPRLLVREQGLAGYLGEFGRKMKAGDLGSIPVVLGLIIIWGIFQGLNANFLSRRTSPTSRSR